MYRILLLFIPFLLSGFLYAQPEELKVMTFNIRYDNPDDGVYAWPNRRSLVELLLVSEKPQIACFQEVLDHQLGQLLRMLPDFGHYGVGRDDGKSAGEFSPILYDRSRFIFISGATRWLSEKPDVPGSRSWGSACTRIVTRVVLFDRFWKDTVVVYNTHLDHVSPLAREKSAALISADILGIKGEPLIILTGDFNDTLGSSSLKPILEGGQIPANPPGMIKPDGPDYTFIGFPFTPQQGTLIDIILTTASGKKRVTASYINTLNLNGFYPSDHLPVFTIFSPPESKP